MIAYFNHNLQLEMTLSQARSASHPGPCDADVEGLVRHPRILKQLRNLDRELIKAELREYGAWDETDLDNHEQNLRRLVWSAACNICEEYDDHHKPILGGKQ